MSSFKLRIVTPHGLYYEGEVEILNVRTKNGQMGILAHRLPLATGLEINEMNFVEKGERKHFALAGGFLYVGKNETTILTDAIESEMSIDLDRALAAKARAEARLADRQNEKIDLQRAEIALRKALVRIRVKKGA
ncbi:ATP synthase epsilon chain [Clostridiales bacterium CHKCI006]|nr:ATP synthase epsilon chain [Clostridiales bacterium CHKCI006]